MNTFEEINVLLDDAGMTLEEAVLRLELTEDVEYKHGYPIQLDPDTLDEVCTICKKVKEYMEEIIDIIGGE